MNSNRKKQLKLPDFKKRKPHYLKDKQQGRIARVEFSHILVIISSLYGQARFKIDKKETIVLP